MIPMLESGKVLTDLNIQFLFYSFENKEGDFDLYMSHKYKSYMWSQVFLYYKNWVMYE